jgi:uncharacterized protein (TIGR03435 family)
MGRCLTLLLLSTLPIWQAYSQTTAIPPSFEVAEIKPADPNNPMPGKGRMLPGGRLDLPGMTLKRIIMFAYGAREDMISGGPKWAGQDRFDIVAKAPPNASQEVIRPMCQSMLADRFELAIHREDKVQSAYVLTLGKRPAKYQQGDGGRQECTWTNLEGRLRRRECHNLTMAEFARQLPGWGGIGIDLPVVDETGLKGAYDFHLDVSASAAKGEGKHPAAALADSGTTIFAALDKIGLKLEARKAPVQVIVIDHAELPEVH